MNSKLNIFALVWTLAAVSACGALIGNPKRPPGGDNSQMILVAESQDAEILGTKVFITSDSPERPDSIVLTPGSTLANSETAARLSLPGEVRAISASVEIASPTKVAEATIKLLVLDIPFDKDFNPAAVDSNHIIVMYRYINAAGQTVFGYAGKKSFVSTDRSSFGFPLKAFGQYQLALLPGAPPSEGQEVLAATPECSGDKLTNELAKNGTGVAGDEYVICTLEQLNQMRGLGLTAHFVLGQDIDAAATASWNGGEGFEPLGVSPPSEESAFKGILNGRGHVISNLNINRPAADAVGLFRNLSGATVSNLRLANVSIKGRASVGGLAASAKNSTIDAVRVDGSVSGTAGEVGGLTGYAQGTPGGTAGSTAAAGRIRKSSFSGSVSAGGQYAGGLSGLALSMVIVESFAAGTITSPDKGVGGLFGQMISSTLSDAYATGTVQSTGSKVGGLVGESVSISSVKNSVERAYSLAEVFAGTRGGRLIGFAEADSYLIATSYSDGGRGCSGCADAQHENGSEIASALFLSRAHFESAGWDFTTPIWQMKDGAAAPGFGW